MRWIVGLAASAAAAAASVGRRTTSSGTSIGGVLTGVGDIDRSRPFIDLMKQSVAFSSLLDPRDQNATVGPDGWPVSDFSFSAIMVGGGAAADQYPADTSVAGVYTIVAQGCATVSLSNTTQGARVVNQSCVDNSLIAFVEIDPTTNNGLLQPLFTNTQRSPSSPIGSGLTNVSVIQPGYTVADARSQIFTTKWLTHLARFDTLRFMPWSLNGTQSQVHWSDRPSVDAPTWLVGSYGTQGPGVPWEIQIALVNAVGCDTWISIPAPIQDDYLEGLAQLLVDTLHESAVVVIEYSNEVWCVVIVNRHRQSMSMLCVATHSPMALACGQEWSLHRSRH